MKTKHSNTILPFCVIFFLILNNISFSQEEKKSAKNGDVGSLIFGVGNSVSRFSDNNRSYTGIGVTGQLRFKLAQNLELETFGDYLTANVSSMAQRMDAHGGFSFVPIFFKKEESHKSLQIKLYE